MLADDDLEKFHFYLNAEFYFFESILVSNLTKKPSSNEIKKMKETMSKQEIEKFYNHFHLSSISENVAKQRDYCINLWKNWRQFFENKMHDKNITIDVKDLKSEIIIYVYEAQI